EFRRVLFRSQHLLDDKKHLSQQVQSLNLGRQDSFLSCRQTLSIDPINKHTFLFSCLDNNSSLTSQNQRQTQTLKFFYLLNKIVRSEEHTSELQSRFDIVC